MWHPLKFRLNHNSDFRVCYRFFTKEEGGLNLLPVQGYKCDFLYPHKEHKKNHVFMIYPEFEDERGNVITDTNVPVPIKGFANMWVMNPIWRPYHIDKIRAGIKGYFVEGPRKVAECEVIEILGLAVNPRA